MLKTSLLPKLAASKAGQALPGSKESSPMSQGRRMSSESIDASLPRNDSKRSLLGSPLQFLRMGVRSLSKQSMDSIDLKSPTVTECASLAASDDDNSDDNASCAGDLPGITVAHLLSIARDPEMTVAEALELLNYGSDDAYVNGLDARDSGSAQSIVLMSNEMCWQDCIATLAENGGSQRRVWIRELCTWSEPVEWKQVVAAVGRVDLVLPSWANPGSFWTPEHLAVTRIAEAKFRVLMAEKNKVPLSKALIKGLPLSYFDDLLSPHGILGAKAVSAIKSFVVGLVVDTPSSKERDEAFAVMMGHLALAVKNYEGAILYYKAQSSLPMLAEAYRRAGNLDSARACLKMALESLGDSESLPRAQCILQRAHIMFELGNFDRALDMAQQALGVFQANHHLDLVSDCWVLMADSYKAMGDLDMATAFLKDSLKVLNELKGSSVKVADALRKLAWLQLVPEDGHGRAALDNLNTALTLLRDTLGDTHATTLGCELDLARANLVMGSAQEAADLQRHVFGQHQLMYGPEDVRCLDTLGQFVDGLVRAGCADEAQQWIEELYARQVNVYGRSSEIVIKTIRRMACMRICVAEDE